MAHLSPRGIEIPLVISKQNRLTIMGRSLSYKGSIINLESIWKLNEIGGVLKACHEQFGKWIQFEKVQFSKNVACPASLLRLTFLNAWNNVCISDCKKKGLCNLEWYYKLCTFTTSIAIGKCFSPNLIRSNATLLLYFGENNTTLKLHTIFNKNEVIMVCTLLADPFFAKATSPSYRLWVHSIRFHEFLVQLWRFH